MSSPIFENWSLSVSPVLSTEEFKIGLVYDPCSCAKKILFSLGDEGAIVGEDLSHSIAGWPSSEDYKNNQHRNITDSLKKQPSPVKVPKNQEADNKTRGNHKEGAKTT